MRVDTDRLLRIAFVDPASGKKDVIKSTRARSAIVCIGVDDCQRVLVLDAWAERCSTERLIERIFAFDDQWRPQTFGIESSAQQSLFADAVLLHSRWQGRSLPVQPVRQPTGIDKDWRIRTAIQPVLADGRLFLQAAHHELRAEIAAFPMGRLKDMVDALASAIALAPPVPMRRERDAEVEALAAYLRETGAPPSYIAQRVREERAAA